MKVCRGPDRRVSYNPLPAFVFLAMLIVTGLFVAPASAGEQVAVKCANPACGYHSQVTLGGAKRAPAITCYCPRCGKFVRIKLPDWSHYHDDRFQCPQCRGAAEPVYSHADITARPCPRCGKVTLKTKSLRRFD